jgi:hypothetical protein
MKRVAIWLIVFVVSVSFVISSGAEENDVSVDAEKTVIGKLDKSSIQREYEEYFKSAYLIIKASRNICVSTQNFLYLSADNFYASETSKSDITFLSNLDSPLALTEGQLSILLKYGDEIEDTGKYSYQQRHALTISQIRNAINYDELIPLCVELFSQLSKPVVPDGYSVVDGLLNKAILSAKAFVDEVNMGNRSQDSIPDYDDNPYEMLTLIYELIE